MMEVDEETVSLDACSQAAESWLGKHSLPWKLLWANEAERKLVFEHQRGGVTFTVALLPPAMSAESGQQGRRSFRAQSDNDKVWSLLKDCHGTSLQECLEKSIVALEPLFGASKRTEIDNDDDDDDDDDYSCGDYFDNSDDVMETGDGVVVGFSSHVARETPNEDDGITDVEYEMYAKSGSKMAVHRLLSDLKMFKRSNCTSGIYGSPRGDNLFLWDVQLTDFDQKSVLGKDLCKYAERFQQKPEVQLEMSFPCDYPMSPPFIRVIRPRFKFLTAHVTIGGSICMELLTKSGWRPTNDIESILVQVRSEIISDPKAGLDMSRPNQEYTRMEAETAFRRMVDRYGWNK
ncbi:ubiquitin-conjugating enzyme E2 Q1-like [Acanthaster planci]|uniref:Ubiquitin-conjugating enzyme E2 Q1-like n=1 Tax=Acanthaster planci TaxID=133434 RepID=A0A8B7XQF5_ACAPL|nr:ubiquitin-conjugating enzyme E2 Q1-like [Acanthaster planci]